MAIILDTSNRSLTVVLTGAKTTKDCPFIATFADQLPGAAARGQDSYQANDGNTNGVAAVTVVPAPGAQGYQRRLKSLNISNQDTAACTYQIGYLDAGTTFILTQITLQTLESLQYEEGLGFWTLDANGAQKSQAASTSSATSVADSKAVSVSVNTSVADSKAVSDSVVISANLSTTTSQSVIASSTGSSMSLNTSTALSTGTAASSQAVSDSVQISANLSSFTSASTITSSAMSIASANQSLGSSAGWSTSLSKTKSSFGF